MNFRKLLNLEISRYLICGVMTTIVNYVVYFILREYTNVPITLANVLAFCVAVTQAFFTNKFLVYRQFNCKFKVLTKEFTSFVSLRIVSMLIETCLLYIFVTYLDLWEYGVKFLVSVIVVVLNYIFGKFITFRRRGDLC